MAAQSLWRLFLRVPSSSPSLTAVATARRKFGMSCRMSFSSENSSSGSGSREFLGLSDEQLMKQCEMSTFKSSGPGGQHRNKRESAVRLKHLPTGIIAQAVEDRSQHKNRASALARLRTLLALKGTV